MPTTLPVQIDIFALFIFLGIVQGLFLAFFFLSKKPFWWSNCFLGALLLCFSLASLEIFLCYTNLMFQVIHLIDFAEPANYLLAPLLYFYIRTKNNNQFNRKDYWHFAPFAFYFCYCCLIFYPQNPIFKYNAYISSYHPQLPKLANEIYWDNRWVFLWKDWVNEITAFSLAVYLVFIFNFIRQSFQTANLPFFSTQNPILAWSRNIFFQMLSILVLFLVVKSSFHRDLGDHILAAHLTLIIYWLSFQVIRQSVFFHPAKPVENEQKEVKELKKYEKSTVTPAIEEEVLQKLTEVMQNQQPFLQPDFSLPVLAKLLKVSPHQLSQVINDKLQQNFFEFTAHYRITAAKDLLLHPQYAHLKIEEIAEMVGYNSKSAFNTSFKKIVGQTPSEFKKKL